MEYRNPRGPELGKNGLDFMPQFWATLRGLTIPQMTKIYPSEKCASVPLVESVLYENGGIHVEEVQRQSLTGVSFRRLGLGLTVCVILLVWMEGNSLFIHTFSLHSLNETEKVFIWVRSWRQRAPLVIDPGGLVEEMLWDKLS